MLQLPRYSLLPQKAIVVFFELLYLLFLIKEHLAVWSYSYKSFGLFFLRCICQISGEVKLLFKALFWLHFDVLNSQLCQIPNS